MCSSLLSDVSYHRELSAIVPVGAVDWMYTSAVFADKSDSEVCKLLVAVLSDVIELLIDVIDVFIVLDTCRMTRYGGLSRTYSIKQTAA